MLLQWKLICVISSGLTNGTFMAERPNPAVSSSLLQEIWNWKQKGVSMTDIVSRLRTRTVPNGYPYHTWKPGKYSLAGK